MALWLLTESCVCLKSLTKKKNQSFYYSILKSSTHYEFLCQIFKIGSQERLNIITIFVLIFPPNFLHPVESLLHWCFQLRKSQLPRKNTCQPQERGGEHANENANECK